MKILVVTIEALSSNTSATIQNKQIIKSLACAGNVVDVLTLEDNKDASGFDQKSEIDNIGINKIFRIPLNNNYVALAEKKEQKASLKSHIIKILKKIYKSFVVYEGLKVNIPNVDKIEVDYSDYDIMLTLSDPKSSHLLGKYIIKNKGYKKKWYQYWGDPMYIDITIKNNWKKILYKINEQKLIKDADKIFYASPLTLDEQKRVYKAYASKMHCINQVANECDEQNDSLYEVGYFGAYGSSIRNIIPFYEALKEGCYKSIIVGNSDVKLQGTDRLEIYDRLPYVDVVNYEANTDILVTLCNLRGTQIPGKVYYNASHKKPMIVIIDGEMKDQLRAYFESFNRFIVCDNDKESILEALKAAKLEIGKEYVLDDRLKLEYIANQMLD